MKLIIALACLILAINASTDEDLWLKFKDDYDKSYDTDSEEKLRFSIFKSNLRVIEEQNAKFEKKEVSWAMGTNQFADLTDEEFKANYLGGFPKREFQVTQIFESASNDSVPDSIDWRERAVLSVEDQRSCGSSWAFSAIGSLEGQNAIKHNITVDLSEQELIDCGGSTGNDGCDGGWMDLAFQYIEKNGISTLDDYPYVWEDRACKFHANSGKIKITGYTSIESNNENDLKRAVGTVGPVSVAIDASSMRLYSHGIFSNINCTQDVNHAVLAVGYGTEDDKDYWLIRNSWGTTWGDSGYIRMSRNRQNQCGIASSACYPNVV